MSSACYDIARKPLEIFCKLLEQQARDGVVRVEDLPRLRARFLQSEPVQHMVAALLQECLAHHEEKIRRGLRADHFSRLLVHEFSELFEQDVLSRQHLGRFRAAVNAILGDEAVHEFQARCAEIVADLRQGDEVDWPAYHDDPRARHVRDCALTLIAKSFYDRFEIRKTWFMKFMDSHPGSISLGGSAYIPAVHTEIAPFRDHDFAALFHALYARCGPATMDAARLAAIRADTGLDARKVIGALLVELARLAGRTPAAARA